jgi:hypothetical protein
LAEFLNASHPGEAEWKKLLDDAPMSDGTAPPIRAIDNYKDQILGALVVGLKAVNTRKPSIIAFSYALDLAGFFSEEELGYIVHTINEVTFESQNATEETDDSSW